MAITKRRKIAASAVFVLIALFVVGSFFLRSTVKTSTSSNSRKVTTLGDSAPAKATVNLDKTFEFRAINQAKTYKNIKFTLVTSERKDEIKVKGETKRAPKDYDFLLVRIEIENSLTERLALAPSDLIRLQDERGKLFAPDYHNGNVILDPLSVRKDLISFVVSKETKKFTFLVGELEGQKEKVEISF